MMSEENKQSPFVSWTLKGLLVLILAVIPATGVFALLLLVPWISIEWIGPTLLLSGFMFLVG